MEFRKILVIGMALGSMALVSILAYRTAFRPAASVCAICGRGLHATVTYHMETAKGEVATCCPRCGMHEQLELPRE